MKLNNLWKLATMISGGIEYPKMGISDETTYRVNRLWVYDCMVSNTDLLKEEV